MADENAPQVESARYVVPFDVDMSEAEAKVERFLSALDERIEKAVSRLEGVEFPAFPAAETPRDGEASPGSAAGVGDMELRDLREEVKKNTDVLAEVRDAIEALTEAIASQTLNEDL